MSVGIMLDTDEFEEFYICVSGANSYKEYWIPAIKALNLKWAPYFDVGCPLEKADWPEISKEFLLIKEWILLYLDEDEISSRNWFCQRFDDIIRQVDEHFRVDGRRLWIC